MVCLPAHICVTRPQCVKSHLIIQNEVTVRKRSIWVKISDFMSRVTLKFDRWPWKINRAPLLCYLKLCASFHSHLWIQNGDTFWKRQIWIKIGDLLTRVTLKFDGWPWKTVGHLFYAASSFMHYSIAIRQFWLELQSGNAKFGSKSTIYCPVWPWNLTNDLDLLHGYHLCHW